MRKTIVIVLALIANTVFAGGIVTNTNQSASFIRMPSRGASLDIDAVYYNPAGLAFLKDGFHFSLNNQYITQTRTISSTFPNMNRREFEGGVSAPLFPSVYGVYKMNRLALSLGVTPIGGGGSATFEEGLPSFETQVSVLPGLLTSAGINTTKYSYETNFDGSSLVWGFQAGASYALNDMVSVSAGLRYLMAKNAYKGYLRDVMINPTHLLNPAGSGNMTSAPGFFGTLAVASSTAAASLQPAINANYGHLTLAQAVSGGLMSQPQADQLAAGLGASYNAAWNLAIIQGAYVGQAAYMNDNAAATSNKEVDAEQSGSAIIPVVGIHFQLTENFNLALKYEHMAKLSVKNKTTSDDVGMYPDGAETRNDMPAMLSIAASYAPVNQLKLHGGFHYYFDKSANYGKSINGEKVANDKVMDKNFWEASFGVEYDITNALRVSTGYLRTQTGVTEKYQSDLSHSLSTNSIGAGLRYAINPNVAVNLGYMRTFYLADTKDFGAYKETYDRKAQVIALGIDLKF